MKRSKVWLGNLGLAVIATVLSVGLAEIAVRIFAPRATSIAAQDRYGLGLHYPGITRYLPLHGQVVSMNAAGMRDREHELAKAEGKFRVLVLGDSFMEAAQVPFEASMPALIEESLGRESGRSVEVVNAAVSGWGTADGLRYLTEYGLAYDPDLVLVAMTLHNDIQDNLREYWFTARDGALVDLQREPIPWFEYKTLQFKTFLAVRLQLVQVWRKVRHGQEMRQTTQALNSHVVELFQEPAREHIDFGFELTDLLLERIQAVSAANGATVALVLLPLEYQLSDEIFADFVRAAAVQPESMSVDRPQRLMIESAARLGIPVVDLAPAFRRWTAERDDPLYVTWDGHWNEAGHRLAADEVTRGLMATGTIGKDGSSP